MALVKCAECKGLVSNRAANCPHCGYAPLGSCRICKWFDWNGSLCSGRCYASKEDFVREYKGVCPAVMKRSLFEVPRKFL